MTHWRLLTEAVFKAVITTAQDGAIEVKLSALCEGTQLNCEQRLADWALFLRIQAEYVQVKAAGCPRPWLSTSRGQ